MIIKSVLRDPYRFRQLGDMTSDEVDEILASTALALELRT